MANVERHGVGAVLDINGTTRAVKNFLDDLPREYGDVMPYSQVHVTLLDYTETAIDIVSERDLIAIRNTTQEMDELLGGVMLGTMVMRPASEKPELKPYGRFLGVELIKSPAVVDLRTRLTDIVFRQMGVEIDPNDPDYEPHMSVLQRPKRDSGVPSRIPKIPSNLHVTGYRTGKHEFDNRSERSRRRGFYTNRPSGLRRVS